jgi:glutamyl-tRNA synthetase
MSEKKVRVRFAPSPTGGLHLGGVRTVLYNYLFARKTGGDFILRIEDTDQTRFVPGAETYIFDCLNWCGLVPDESPLAGGPYGPYRQSERKEIYRAYAEQLVDDGYAYYAFDTSEELEQMRTDFKTPANPSPQYDATLRMKMKNSLRLSVAETKNLLEAGTPHVIRIKMPEDETVRFEDLIRGEISFQTSSVDDKVLLKADGMPTYHLAVVVDDYLMKITHAFRGEEWLPSAPVHILLWKYLGWESAMPEWAHLPLILKPDGHGKLSKRDGDRLGFPVFAMNWTDPRTGELTPGFRELGFLPEAFVNLLAMLGWNDGSEKEIFTLEELIDAFSIDRVHKGGARFDFEKARWFNQEWIRKCRAAELLPHVRKVFSDRGLTSEDDKLTKIIPMIKDRCTLLNDFYEQGVFFFRAPQAYDLPAVKPKWNHEKKAFFQSWVKELESMPGWEHTELENSFKTCAADAGLKAGELMLPLRVMLVGGKFGPPVFDISVYLGREETINRVQRATEIFSA